MRRTAHRLAIALCLTAAACDRGSAPTSATPAAAALSGVSLSSSFVTGGVTVTGTVAVTAAAPADGATIVLASSSAAATVPASVTIAAGATSQTFDIQTAAAAVPATATITATYSGVARTAALAIGKLTIQSLSLSAASAIGGASVGATITLAAPAPDGGTDVVLASSSPAAIVPGRVAIAGGASTQTFTIRTVDTPTPTDVTITATLPFSGGSREATLTVARLAIQRVSVGLNTVPGGVPLAGTVELTVAAPADLQVALSSNRTVARVPPSATIPAGTTSQTFDITTVNSPPTTTATITAAYAGTSQSATFTVVAYPNVASLSCSSTMPKGGTTVTCTGTLVDPAPAGGWQLAFTTSDAALAGPVPASLTVPASSVTFRFEIVTAPVTSSLPAVIRVTDVASGLVLYSQAFTIVP